MFGESSHTSRCCRSVATNTMAVDTGVEDGTTGQKRAPDTEINTYKNLIHDKGQIIWEAWASNKHRITMASSTKLTHGLVVKSKRLKFSEHRNFYDLEGIF